VADDRGSARPAKAVHERLEALRDLEQARALVTAAALLGAPGPGLVDGRGGRRGAGCFDQAALVATPAAALAAKVFGTVIAARSAAAAARGRRYRQPRLPDSSRFDRGKSAGGGSWIPVPNENFRLAPGLPLSRTIGIVQRPGSRIRRAPHYQ
jgi:hypothetical protein